MSNATIPTIPLATFATSVAFNLAVGGANCVADLFAEAAVRRAWRRHYREQDRRRNESAAAAAAAADSAEMLAELALLHYIARERGRSLSAVR